MPIAHFGRLLVSLRAGLLNTHSLARILAQLGVTDVEYWAMTCPAYEIPLAPRAMARYTVAEVRSETPRESPPYTADDYLAALHGMLAKGWLEIAPDPAAEIARYDEEGLPRELDLAPPAGTVAFNRRGHFLHRRIVAALRGKDWLRNADWLKYDDEQKREVFFFARTKKRCLQWIEATRNHDSCYGATLTNLGPSKIVQIEGPVRCAFRLSRFQVVRRGFGVTVRCESLQPLPFHVEGVDVQGQIESFEPIAISGVVAGKKFRFSESSYRQCEAIDARLYFDWYFHIWGPMKIEERPELMLSDDTGPVPVRHQPSLEYSLREGPAAPGRTEPLSVDEARAIATNCLLAYLDRLVDC